MPANDKKGNWTNQGKRAQTRGMAIMELAEILRPGLNTMFANAKDKEGFPVAAERIRGISLALAQELLDDWQKMLAA